MVEKLSMTYIWRIFFRTVCRATLLFGLTLHTTSAFGAEATMRIQAKVIQCGPVEQIERACMENAACCNLIDEIAQTSSADDATPHDAPLDKAIKKARRDRTMETARASMKYRVASFQDDIFTANDTDHDGAVSRDEFLARHNNATPGIFNKLDRNNDGKLSKPELSKFRAAMGG